MAMSTKTYSLCIDGEVVLVGSSRKINDVYSVLMNYIYRISVSSPNVSRPVVTVVVNM